MMTTAKLTDGTTLTLTPTALASGRYEIERVVETIPVRSRPAERRWHVR